MRPRVQMWRTEAGDIFLGGRWRLEKFMSSRIVLWIGETLSQRREFDPLASASLLPPNRKTGHSGAIESHENVETSFAAGSRYVREREPEILARIHLTHAGETFSERASSVRYPVAT